MQELYEEILGDPGLPHQGSLICHFFFAGAVRARSSDGHQYILF